MNNPINPFGSPQTGGLSAEELQQQNIIKTMQTAMESCPIKSGISGVMGFGLGGLFGLFMSSMRYDTPMSSALSPQAQAVEGLPWQEQLRRGGKDMGRSMWGSAKNFGMVGMIFAGSECCIEAFRAKNDIYNGILGGCATGGILGAKAGPQAAALGCAGFAAFSTAIEYYLRMPGDGGSRPVI